MPTGRITMNADVGGVAMASTITRTADGHIGHSPTLPIALAGTLSTRSTDTAGTLTLGAGHGLVQTNIVDLYWAGGRRYDVVVGVVDGNNVPISGGSGDVLPTQTTAITTQQQTVIDTDFDADLLEMIAMCCANRGHASFYETGAIALAVDLPAGEVWEWHSGGSATNPLAGKTIDRVVVTQAATATTATLKLGGLYNSTS